MIKMYALALLFCTFGTAANDYTWEKISKRNPDLILAEQEVAGAKMQGECLVGLKNLNFKKLDKFDPVSEWTNYRSISLLEQYSPCQVLIIMEVAQSKLRE